MSPTLTKRKFLEVLHDPGKFTFQSLLSCYQLRASLVQRTHVSSSCHGFPNAGVEGQLPAPAGRFPFERLNVRRGELRWHRVVFTVFFTASARSTFYCSLPESKWVLFFSPRNALYPLFLPEDKNAPRVWRFVRSTKRGSHRVRPRPLAPSPPCPHTASLHIHEPALFPRCPNRSICVSLHTHPRRWYFPSRALCTVLDHGL